MKLATTILFFALTALLTSCNGQSKTQSDQNPLNVKGDTVAVLSNSIWSIFQDKLNNYWFGSKEEGLYRYDGKIIIHFTSKDGLSDNKISDIQEDKQGNVYLTTGKGINKFDGKNFIALKVIDEGTSTNKWKIDTNDLWFQGENFTYRYDGVNLYRLNFPMTKLHQARIKTNSIDPSGVYSIYKDNKNNLWFGTGNLGVCRFDGKSFEWFTEKGLAEGAVRSIFQDKNGNMWFGNSGNGICKLEGKQLTNYRNEKGIGNLKENALDFPVSYMSVCEDKDGNLWIATYNCGVWKFDGETASHISTGNLTHKLMYMDKKGKLWLGTDEDGVYQFNGTTFEKANL